MIYVVSLIPQGRPAVEVRLLPWSDICIERGETVMVMEVRMGDVVRLRKQHPCGSDQWQVVRLGADIGIRCLGCDRRVLLPRRKFEKSVKELIQKGEGPSKHPLTDN